MNNTIRTLSCVWATLGCLTACNFDLKGSADFADSKVTVSQDDDSDVPQGQTVAVTLTAENFFLWPPDEAPPPEHVADAGHFQIYLDDFDSEPLVVTANTSVEVTIPPDTEVGDHKLKCRVHKHDGEATNTSVDVDIFVIVNGDTGEGEGE